MVAASDVDVEQEADEMAVVELSQAVVHPRTVMIWCAPRSEGIEE